MEIQLQNSQSAMLDSPPPNQVFVSANQLVFYYELLNNQLVKFSKTGIAQTML